MGVIGASGALVFMRSLPPSRHFKRQMVRLRSELSMFADLFRDRGLPWLFAEGFVLLGTLVTVYNYIGYRLMAPPYAMSQARVGMIFSVYLVGVVSSPWMGHLAGRIGRRKVLWSMLLLVQVGDDDQFCGSSSAGTIVITFGFFGAHSVASSWVGRRRRRQGARSSISFVRLLHGLERGGSGRRGVLRRRRVGTEWRAFVGSLGGLRPHGGVAALLFGAATAAEAADPVRISAAVTAPRERGKTGS